MVDGSTGESFSEALFLASTNPQYDKGLFMDLPVQNMKLQTTQSVYTTCSEFVVFMY